MLHALALVKFKDGGTKELLKAFFQVTLVHGHLAAQFFNGNGIANVLQQDFPGPDHLFAVGLVGQELTADGIDLLLALHTIQAVEQQHLGLCVYINIGQGTGVAMVYQSFQHRPGFVAQRQRLGKRGRVREGQDALAKGGSTVAAFTELIQKRSPERKGEQVDGFNLFRAVVNHFLQTTGAAGFIVLAAVHVAGNAEPQLHVLLVGAGRRIVIVDHTQILTHPVVGFGKTLNGIVHGTRYLLAGFVYQPLCGGRCVNPLKRRNSLHVQQQR